MGPIVCVWICVVSRQATSLLQPLLVCPMVTTVDRFPCTSPNGESTGFPVLAPMVTTVDRFHCASPNGDHCRQVSLC